MEGPERANHFAQNSVQCNNRFPVTEADTVGCVRQVDRNAASFRKMYHKTAIQIRPGKTFARCSQKSK